MGRPKKSVKDPMAPKRPMSSYLEFAKEERAQVLADKGKLSLVEVGKELGRRWQNLPSEEKNIFVNRHNLNKEKYTKELEDYRKTWLESSSSKQSSNTQQSSSLPSDPGQSSTPKQSSNAPQPSTSQQSSIPQYFSTPQLSSMAQQPSTSGQSSFPQLQSNEPPMEIQLVAADLGFARQRGYPWHPAMRTGVFARGTRIRVTFFGTGETGSVDKNKWTSYSEKVAERIITPRMLKNTGFKMGLDQLKNNLKKISTSSTGQEVITNPSVSFANQPEGRKLVKLNKDRLQKEEEENIRLMHEKIEERDGSPHKYGCKACSWKGKFLHKAKAHIRDCGSRRKERKRNPKNKKYSCSGKDCNMVFPCLSKLQDHYRVCHFQPEQGYNCVPCQTIFSSWKNFKRHMESKHGETASLHCNSCAYKTHRMDNMVRHMESQHSNLKMISSLVNDLISQLGACDVAEDDFVEENPNDEEPVEEEGPSEGDSSDDQEEELSPHLRERNEHVANVQAEFRRLFPTFESEVLELKSQGRKRGGGGRRKKSPRSLPLRRSSRAGSNIFAEISELQEELDAGRSDDESASEVVTGGGCELSASRAVGDQVIGGRGHGEGGQGSGEHVQGDGGLQGESEGDLQGASGGNHQGPEKGAHWSGVGGNQGEGSGDQGDVDGGLHVQVEEGNLMAGVLGAAQEQDLHALGKFGCQSCDMSFRDTGNLRRHVKLVHTSRMIPVKCPRSWCDAEFLILANMLSHKEDCLRVCPYPGCVKKFSKQNRFDGHQRAHLTMTRRMSD